MNSLEGVGNGFFGFQDLTLSPVPRPWVAFLLHTLSLQVPRGNIPQLQASWSGAPGRTDKIIERLDDISRRLGKITLTITWGNFPLRRRRKLLEKDQAYNFCEIRTQVPKSFDRSFIWHFPFKFPRPYMCIVYFSILPEPQLKIWIWKRWIQSSRGPSDKAPEADRCELQGPKMSLSKQLSHLKDVRTNRVHFTYVDLNLSTKQENKKMNEMQM